MKRLRVVPAMAVLLAGVLSVPAGAARGERGGGDWHGGRAAISGGGDFATSRAGGWGNERVSRSGSMVRVGGSRYLAPARATQTWSARRATAAWPAPIAERRVEGVRTQWPRYRHGARRIADNRWNHGRRVRVSGYRVSAPRTAWYGGGYYGSPYGYYETGQPYVADYDYGGFGYAGYGDAYTQVYRAEPVAEGPIDECVIAEPEAVAGSGAIVAVQIALRDRGFYRGEVDGISGPRTRSAVREFKQCVGLPVNSRLDGSLLDALNLQ